MKSLFLPLCQTVYRLGFLPPSEATALWVIAIWIILFSALVIGLYRSSRSKLLLLASLPALLLSSFVVFFITSLIIEPLGNPIASIYFPLNAAVKNTCFTDPLHRNCPTTLEELVKIEPENFSPLLRGKFAVFHHPPQSNEYSLIIKHDRWRGVLFDPRLSLAGVDDFIDIQFNSCNPSAPPTPFYGSTEPWKSAWIKYNQIVDLKSLLK